MELLEDKRPHDYQSFLDSYGEDSKVRLIFALRDWFFQNLEFDPNSGEPLDGDLTAFLDKLSGLAKNPESGESDGKNFFDWIYHTLSYSERSLFYVMESPRKEVLRTHERMNIYRAHEIDTAGIMEISRRPGRTVREKISVNPTVLAVKREQSQDTLENRLYKKFLKRLIPVLERRQNIFCNPDNDKENEDSKLSRIYNKARRWLKNDEADIIGEWRNLPPNNILLCDKHYKKIWKSWQYLLDLDEYTKSDWENVNNLLATYMYWNTLALLQKNGARIKQAPLSFDYNAFSVSTRAFKNEVKAESDIFSLTLKDNVISVRYTNGKEYKIEISLCEVRINGEKIPDKIVCLEDAKKIAEKLANSVHKEKQARTLPLKNTEIQKFVSISFSEFPYSAVCISNENEELRKDFSVRLTRQFWKAKSSSNYENLDCSLSPSLYEQDVVTDYEILNCRFEDIIYKNDEETNLSSELKTEAAWNFMNNFREYYNTSKLYYSYADYLEDFSLSTLRSAANSVFSSANPVPESIGAVFDLQRSKDFDSFKLSDGDFVFVIQKNLENTVLSITPIQSKTTFEHKNGNKVNLKDYPEIPGSIRWEHHPSFIKADYEPARIMEYIQDAVRKTEGSSGKKILIISSQKSIGNARLELPDSRWKFINQPFDAARGMSFCAVLQDSVTEIPLWSEHLPELQMTYLKDGKRSLINLTHGKTVLPIRGQKQKIEIAEKFTLNKNVPSYHFRLARGDSDSNTLRYEACLANSSFPLKREAECRLEMYYAYGEEQPFELYFVPVSSTEFIRAKVEWKKIDEGAFPVPNFPPVRAWSEFENWDDGYTENPRDLTDWELKNFDKIQSISDFTHCKKNEFERYSYTYTRSERLQKDVYGLFITIPVENGIAAKIYQNQLKDIVGQPVVISFSLNLKKFEKQGDGAIVYRTYGVTQGISLNNKRLSSFSRSFRFPAIQIWNTSQSVLYRDDASENFVSKVKEIKEVINELLDNDEVYQQTMLWDEIFLQTCFMHTDAIEISSKWLETSFFDEFDFENENWKSAEQKLFQVGYFIGNADTEKQKEFFTWLLQLNTDNEVLNSFKLQALCIALWRGENLLEKISAEKMSVILESAKTAIKSEYENLQHEELSNRKLNPLRSYLELLCALLRSRQFGKKYQDLFSPFSDSIKELVKLVEEIYQWLKLKDKILFARQIKFTTKDADSHSQFLDYLLLWLDGENSSEMPRVESATSDSPDDDDADDSEE